MRDAGADAADGVCVCVCVRDAGADAADGVCVRDAGADAADGVCVQGRRTRGGCGCFNTHTFPDERVQHPHFFCSFYAVLHKRLTAVAPRFLWPLCVWECARCGCLLSPPSQT